MAYRTIFCIVANMIAMPALCANQGPVNYDGAQVWRTPLRNRKDYEMFQKIKAAEDISIWNLDKKHADYLVSSDNRIKVHRRLEQKRLNHTVLIMNVQRKIESSKVAPIPWTDSSLRVGHRLNFQSYPSMHIIDEYMEYLKENFPSILRISSIGNTVENRTIKLLHISNGNPSNKAILLVGGQHAREWVSITSTLYIANNILTKFDKQPEYMKNKDWYIVPLLNPDGYAYTQTTDRLWRKNRRRNPRPSCYGVDINRNYPKHWHIQGLTQSNACEEDYAGPFALSEPESLALLNMLDSIGPKVPTAFVDFHSYGQMIMYPWAIKGKQSEHKVFLESTAEIIKSGLYNATGRKYTHGTPTQLLYAVSGTAIDWLHSKGIPLSYAIETRDTGSHGFLLPSSQIEDLSIYLFSLLQSTAGRRPPPWLATIPDLPLSPIEDTGKELLGAIRALSKSLDPAISMRDGLERRWF